MPGHAGGRQGLLPDQQELCQRPAGAGTPPLRGQDDGGERSAVGVDIWIMSRLLKERSDCYRLYKKKTPRC